MMKLRSGRFWLLGLLAAMPSIAMAQATECRIPGTLEAGPPMRAAGVRRVTPVTGYVLALSWSPEYCQGKQDHRRDMYQCSGDYGDFGFILHGLWADGSGSADPQYCRSVPPVPVSVMRQSLCIMPSPTLQNHEWAKHGSCAFPSAENYFKASRTLFNAIRFPEMEALSHMRDLTAGHLTRAFASANIGLETDMVSVQTNARGWLDEVWICLGRTFRPVRCSADKRGAPAASRLKIWRER